MTQLWPNPDSVRWYTEWLGDLPYDRNSIVLYNGSSYRATVDIPAGVEPGTDSRWVLVAQGGVDGAPCDIAGLVGVAIPFVDLDLVDGFFETPEGALPSQIGMDLTGVVWLRGQILPAVTTGTDPPGQLTTFAQIIDIALKPDRRVRVPIATAAGNIQHLVVEPNGDLKTASTSGEIFHVDAAYPSGAAFGDARHRDLAYSLRADPDDTIPLRAFGPRIVGAFNMAGTDATTDTDLVYIANVEPAPGKHWHFAGTGTYTAVGGGSGTVVVGSDDALRIVNIDPDPGAAGIRVIFDQPGITVTEES